MLIRSCLSILFCLAVLALDARAQHDSEPLENLINEQVNRYALSSSNRFRLAAYLELEGEFSYPGSVNLNFGQLGSFIFYPDNCLLRTNRARVYHITPRDGLSAQVDALNDALDQIFERIALLSNGDATDDHVRFVDRELGRKNLDSFHKLYVRYLLIHYGKFDARRQRVSLHTDALRADGLIDASSRYEPLMMVLDTNALRGMYHRTGGRVFVEDVDRDVLYATGEEMTPNVGAFKLFLRKFLGRAVSYLSTNPEVKRPAKVAVKPVASKRLSTSSKKSGIAPLYHDYSWIPMMLGMLRTNDLSFGDPDIVKYFADQPCLDKIYEQLTREEKAQVDAYLKKHRR